MSFRIKSFIPDTTSQENNTEQQQEIIVVPDVWKLHINHLIPEDVDIYSYDNVRLIGKTLGDSPMIVNRKKWKIWINSEYLGQQNNDPVWYFRRFNDGKVIEVHDPPTYYYYVYLMHENRPMTAEELAIMEFQRVLQLNGNPKLSEDDEVAYYFLCFLSLAFALNSGVLKISSM